MTGEARRLAAQRATGKRTARRRRELFPELVKTLERVTSALEARLWDCYLDGSPETRAARALIREASSRLDGA